MKKGELYLRKRHYFPVGYIFYLILSDIQWDSLGYYYHVFAYSDIGCKKQKIKNTVFNQKAYTCNSSGKIINVPNEICISKDSCRNIPNGSWKKVKGKIPKKTENLNLDKFSCNTGYHQDISLPKMKPKMTCTPDILTKLCIKTPDYDTGNRKGGLTKTYVDVVYNDLDSVCKVDPTTGFFKNKKTSIFFILIYKFF